MSNNRKTSVEWLIEQFYNNEGMLTTKQLERAKKIESEHLQEQYQDGFEFAIIHHCTTESTSKANTYSDGYFAGYEKALQLVKLKIDNELTKNK